MTYRVTPLEGEHPTETLFLAALQRILDRQPLQSRTRKLQAHGDLRVCQEHVAWEAGRSSRTPISGDAARWPRVRDEIERARRFTEAASRGQPDLRDRDARHEVGRLRARIAELEKKLRIVTAERDLATNRQAAHVLIIERLKRQRPASVRTAEDRLAERRSAEERITPDL